MHPKTTDHYEWVCRSPSCTCADDDRVIIRVRTNYAPYYKARLESAYGDIVHCVCGAEAVERRVHVDGSARELHPDGVMNDVSADGDVKYIGKMKF